jgi:hypothetical protein
MPPRLFLHEFLKPKEEITENIKARRVFEYNCSPTLMLGFSHQQQYLTPSLSPGGKSSMTTFSMGQCTHSILS